MSLDTAHQGTFLEQYGEWVAFGLLFALGDGKREHWTWDVESRTIGRCDLELLFFEQGKVSDYRAPLDMLGVRASIKSGVGADFEAFARGVRSMVEKFRERRVEVQEVLARGVRGGRAGGALSHQGPSGQAGEAWGRTTRPS